MCAVKNPCPSAWPRWRRRGRVVGVPVREEIRVRSGNTWTKGTVVVTDYRVTVTAVSVPGYVPGYTVRVGDDDCTSEDSAFDIKSTNPRARIYSDYDFQSADCRLAGLPNGEVRLSGERREPTFEVVVDDGVNPLKASDELRLRGGTGDASAPLIDLGSEQAVATVPINVDLTKLAGRKQESETFDGITLRSVVVPYRTTITVSDGRSGVAHCPAVYVTEKIIMRPGTDAGRH